MLSAGHRFSLKGKVIFCRACSWEDVSTLLKTKLVPINDTALLLYTYCCPKCTSFDLGIKGELLSFTMPNHPPDEEENSLIDSRTLFDDGKPKKNRAR
jgi:hypothetical protein